MFKQNKYLTYYYNIVNNVKSQQRIKIKNDNMQMHHIVPRSLGGNDEFDNLVLLTFKEHKLLHRLLIKITEGENKYKMMHAYKFFDKNFYVPPIGFTPESHLKGVETRIKKGSYKKGKDNVFSTEKIKNLVKVRMKENNPMKRDEVKSKYLKNRPHSIHIMTPRGYFYSLKSAAKEYNMSSHMLKKFILNEKPEGFIFLTAGDRR